MSPALSLSLSLFVHLLCAATINLAFIFTFLPSCPVPVLVLSAPLFLDTPTNTPLRQHCCVPLSFSYAIFHAKCNMKVGKTSALLKIESYTPPPNKKKKRKSNKNGRKCTKNWALVRESGNANNEDTKTKLY